MARTRSAGKRFFVAAMTIVVAGVAIWWWRSAHPGEARRPDAAARVERAATPPRVEPAAPVTKVQPPPTAAPVAAPVPVTAAPTVAATPPAPAPVAAAIATAATAPAASPSVAPSAVMAEASAAQAAGNLIQARRLLNQAADPTSDAPEDLQVLQQLTKIADEVTFGPKILQNDPLVVKHVVEPGQNLQKIANLYKTTVPLICRVNNLSNPNSLRQGQSLKIALGPFHAVISKHNYRMAVYCQDTLVRIFPVGLGAEGTTPSGRWTIRLKQLKPRYYPPRGGKVLEPDDPANPLGGYWMELEGVEGAAVGEEHYGIHGTIDPESIGKNASMGCIRMRNEDVAFVYEMLVVHDSVVTVKD